MADKRNELEQKLCEILTHNLKRAYFNGSTDVKARESGVISNDTKLGEVMIQVLVAEAKQQILALIEQREHEARIDEIELTKRNSDLSHVGAGWFGNENINDHFAYEIPPSYFNERIDALKAGE